MMSLQEVAATAAPSDITQSDTDVIQLDKLQAVATEQHELPGNNWLFFHERSESCTIEVVIAIWDHEYEGVAYVHPMIVGWGTGDPLYEPRHLHVSDGGYLFYAPMKALAKAFEILAKVFPDY